MPVVRPLSLIVLAAAVLVAVFANAGDDRVHVTPDSDASAIELAQSVVAKMGGWEGWDATRYVVFDFFGGRRHHWDRQTGDWRCDMENEGVRTVYLMNVDSKQGRVWKDGRALSGDERDAALEQAHQIWVNDTYWMFMPFKLLDPGVTLRHGGETKLGNGDAADVLVMTFEDGTGYTPRNRYDVMVGRESGLVEAWAFYADREDEEPRFTMPWTGWQRFGSIQIATDHGRQRDWAIEVPDSLPRSVFTDPAPPER